MEKPYDNHVDISLSNNILLTFVILLNFVNYNQIDRQALIANMSNFRYIVYSAKLLVPTKLNFDSAKKRKADVSQELQLESQSEIKGIAHWIDQNTDYDFVVVTHDPAKIEGRNCFRWCEDITCEHQHLLVHSDENVKHMEQTLKSFIRHESKVLPDIRARIFIPGDEKLSFALQFLNLKREDIKRRGEVFETLFRADDLNIDLATKRNDNMDAVWEIERSSGVRRTDWAAMSEYQQRLLAKIDSLESSGSPFKRSLEDFIDILAVGWGSFYRSDHSSYLHVQCGLSNAQCSCWECWESGLESADESSRSKDSQ